MKERFGIKVDVFMLIGLIVLGFLSIHKPHHHHGDKICTEQSDTFTSHPSHEECQIENLQIFVKAETECNYTPVPIHAANLSAFEFEFINDSDYSLIYLAEKAGNACTLYLSLSHKLRGSPRFS